MFPARVPNPFDDDAKRLARIEAELPTTSRRAALIIAGGAGALIVFGLAWLFGFPGVGFGLVPFGILMILLGSIELLLSWL